MTATATAPRESERIVPLELYRDDGPIARGIGRLLGGVARIPVVAGTIGAAVPLFAAIAIAGSGASRIAVGLPIAWAVLVVGAVSGRPVRGPVSWLQPSLLRAIEYGGVLWIAAVAGGSALPAAFALLCAVAFRHYELAYGLRYRGEATPDWVRTVGGGWDGRLLLAYVLFVVGALPVGLYALAAILGAIFAGESAVAWARFNRAQAPDAYEEEEHGELEAAGG
jgi:hypothetical protein